ncbi:calcineurin-like phosphoesterase C-terminal domain-containing protein [Fibrella forsythiae]|uniref:Calcineurin-like phosphoesterase C-terminal domain-containing protein n=1 Tax=Fibrella forsythiae TaxID=2817061 RepID=A0ABS3JU18_9BACT|nr:calcineurin-like phosphoesterase family protein [Fibrella forsythiae]MBO0952694.1 calcineurin-like phosphoesterase C-terminal domain-containing protein [Fibrella forsythiae]
MVNRRSFLKYLGWSGAAVTTAAPVAVAHTYPATNVPGTITGRVLGNGKGIANVAVTDGYSVVVTDKNGQYSLPAAAAAEFVYISLPAGYAVPHERGVAQFFQPITAKNGGLTADFKLEKLAVDDRKHQFVVWADTQIISKKDGEQLKAQSAPDLRDLVASYPKDSLFHGIGCGDLVWDHFELYADYKEAIGMTGVPFFNVIGNHDLDLDARSDDYSAKTFKQQFGPTYYSFNRGQVHYVMLDDVFFIGTAKKYIGYLTENQLHWLEQDLKLVKPGTTVVVSLHIPTQTGHKRRENLKEEELGGSVSNRKQLYEMLKPFNAHIMSGHTHVNEKWEEGSVMEHVHGTVCGAWWTGPICSDGTPSGYAVYEVDGGDIRWYYKSTGKPREHQLRLYEKGRVKTAPDHMAVNVWNWDPKWKLEWLEDGVMKGTPEQRVAHDPWAVELYAGPDLPKKHKFVDPTMTDHLFFFQPSVSAKKITVRATDRFGGVYTETMTLA